MKTSKDAVILGFITSSTAVSGDCQSLQKPKISLQVSNLQSQTFTTSHSQPQLLTLKGRDLWGRISYSQTLAMARHSAPRFSLHKKFLFALVFFFSVSTVVFLIKRAPSISCDRHSDAGVKRFEPLPQFGAAPSPLSFMKSKRVLLVSHELSLSGNILESPELSVFMRFWND